jgi:hypothetical protein
MFRRADRPANVLVPVTGNHGDSELIAPAHAHAQQVGALRHTLPLRICLGLAVGAVDGHHVRADLFVGEHE